jgi:hypothetical protein
MPEFDYTVTKYPADSGPMTIQDDLQALGANGWRLISVVGVAGQLFVFVERPLEDHDG